MTARMSTYRKRGGSTSLPVLVWEISTQYHARVDRKDGRTLLIVMGHAIEKGWGAIAIEGNTKTLGSEKILDDHAHSPICSGLTEFGASTACRNFAARWLTGKSAAACVCKPIKAMTKAKAKAKTKTKTKAKKRIVFENGTRRVETFG